MKHNLNYVSNPYSSLYHKYLYTVYILHLRSIAFWSLTLDPNKTIEEVEFPPSVGPGTPIGPSDFIGLLSKAGVLSNFVQNVGWQGAIFVCLEDHT